MAKLSGMFDESCGHDNEHMKSVETMTICPKGMKYVMELVKCGDIAPITCETCLIGWLCDDALDYCVKCDDDTPKWYVQCVQPVEFWVNQYEAWIKHMTQPKTCGCVQ